jgi:hypothetical protein
MLRAMARARFRTLISLRRLRGLRLLACVMVGVVALAIDGAEVSAEPGLAASYRASVADSGWEVTVDHEWGVVSVGPHGRSLEAVFSNGGCGSRNDHASVQETKTTVSVTLLREVPTGGELVCPEIEVIARMRVQLAATLAGRLILGLPAWNSSAGPLLRSVIGQADTSAGLMPLAPRLIGFAPADAEGALKLLGLRASIRVVHGGHGLARVARQSPSPGVVAPLGEPVRLRVIER